MNILIVPDNNRDYTHVLGSAQIKADYDLVVTEKGSIIKDRYGNTRVGVLR